MGDYNFLKYFVCAHNKWNPFSAEVTKLPEFYWLMAFQMIKLELKSKWEDFLKPTAELISSIDSPENYKIYREYQDKISHAKGRGEAVEAKVGDTTIAVANTHYDPLRGLVDDNGNVLIPKERFEKTHGFDGIAFSM